MTAGAVIVDPCYAERRRAASQAAMFET